MRNLDDVFCDLENLCVLCKVLACSLDECEYTQFTVEDFSCCLHHLNASLNNLIAELADCLDFRQLN